MSANTTVVQVERKMGLDYGIIWQEVVDFLGIPVPDSLKDLPIVVHEMLDINGIEAQGHVVLPFQCVKKAVIADVDGQNQALTASFISEKMCEGHFRRLPIIPLLYFSMTMALTGDILINSITGSDFLPLAEKADGVFSKVKRIEDMVSPPAWIFVQAKMMRSRTNHKGGVHWIQAASWVDGKPMGVIPKITYSSPQASDFYRIRKESDAAKKSFLQ